MAAEGYHDVVFGFLRREFGPLRHAAKLLARIAGASPRTAENWLTGANAPSGDSLIALMAERDDLADEINRLVAARRAALRTEARLAVDLARQRLAGETHAEQGESDPVAALARGAGANGG